MSGPTDTLVVIPCLNEAAHIGSLLTQLLADPGCRTAMIVVADGGSTDATRAIVAQHAGHDDRVRLIDNPKRIQSSGVNGAVRALGGGMRWLVRIDAHARYPSAYVDGLIAALRRTGAQSVVAPMVTEGRGCFQRGVAAAQNSKLGTGGSAHRIGAKSDWIDHGHHAAWAIDAFRAIGGYDETFSHNEDAELDRRLTQSGARIWLAAELPITYFPRATPGRLFKQYLGYGGGRARTARLHRMPLKPRQMLPLLIAPAVLAAFVGPWSWLAAIPAGVWALACLGYGVALAARERDPCVLASGPAAMIMHLAWSLGYWRERLFAPAPRKA
jgi:succinoglycan biosynthesis protein ExoA